MEGKNSTEILNDYMCNLKVMNNNLYNMHFNIIGASFFGMHQKLQDYYEKLAFMYDAAAERIKMLGGYPITSLKQISEVSTIKSMKSQDYDGKQVLEVLDNDFNFLTSYTRDLIDIFNNKGDIYTINMLSDNLNFFEKQLWMIQSSLK